jgi:hypothetical protein
LQQLQVVVVVMVVMVVVAVVCHPSVPRTGFGSNGAIIHYHPQEGSNNK